MRTKKTGRPAEIDRGDLLDAAEKLFAEHGFEGTTTREVVKRAKCNLALISYYFGSKDGLYQAVLIRHFEALKIRYAATDLSEASLIKQWPEFKDPVRRQFCGTLFALSQNMIANTSMQKIICRELMTGATQMVVALTKSEGGLYNLVLACVRELQTQGKISKDMDLRYGVLSIVGPMVYSCICSPLLKTMYGFSAMDERYVRDLCLHQTRTFFDGWGV
jgi:AcrR family transcriptional regulator